MFLPLILLMILPKLINTQDPEMQRVCNSMTLHLEHSVVSTDIIIITLQ